MNIICENCGQELSNNATMCNLCGEQLNTGNTLKPSPVLASTQIPLMNVNTPSFASKANEMVQKLPPKKIAIIVAAVVVFTLIAALAGGGGNALVGVWKYDMNASEGAPPLFLADSIEFASNGTIRFSQGFGFQDAGSWSASGGRVSVIDNGWAGSNYSFRYSIRGNTLTIVGDNWDIVYTKGKK